MKNVFFLIPFFLILSLLPANAANEKDEWVGPKFKLESLEGKKLSQSDVFKGAEVYLIDFWASWCKPCNKYLPHLADMVEKYGERGFKVVIFCVDDASSKSSAKTLLKSKDYPFTILFDPENNLKNKLGVKRIPTTVILNKKGEELWRHVGYESGVEKDVAEKVESFLPPLKNEQ